MRVKIGKYCNYWGSYQLADLLQYIGVSEERCYKIGEYFSDTKLQDILEWVYEKRKRKIKVMIHDYDIWDTPSTLALIILPMLKMIKEDEHGCPWVDDSEVPEELRSHNAPPKENEWDWDDLVFKRWDWVLGEIIFAFEKMQPDCDWENEFHSGNIDFSFKQCEDNPLLSKMVSGSANTHVFDREGHDKVDARINNGMRLFGKFFRNLWT